MGSENLIRRSVVSPAPRGEVFDRGHDEPVAANVESFSVMVTPAAVPCGEHHRLLADLAEALGLPAGQLQQRVRPEQCNSRERVRLRRGVPLSTVTYLAENISEYPGVSWSSAPTRFYPEGSRLAHVLGYVDQITPGELQVLYNQGYSAQSVLGKSEIERQYAQLLQGEPGRSIRMVVHTATLFRRMTKER